MGVGRRVILIVTLALAGAAVPAQVGDGSERMGPSLGVPAAPGGRTASTATASASRLADPETESEKLAKVRAAFILQIIRFTRWPAERFADEQSPIVVGVPRGVSMLPFLQGTFRHRTVGDRPIILRELDLEPRGPGVLVQPEADAAIIDAAIATCHLVYIPGRDARLVRRTWSAARNAHVLVVADRRSFVDEGAAVVLPVGERAVELVVNRTLLESSEVELSSRVLKLATVVEREVRP